MNRLDGKIAVVTGATSGIGAAIAHRFVAEGAQVVLSGRRTKNGLAIAERLGPAASFHRADVSVDTEVEDLVRTTADRFGRIDVLVNNAGAPATISSVTDVDLADFRRAFDVNVCGPLLGIKYAAGYMCAQGAGSIINIGSIAGTRVANSGLDYSVSKAGLHHLSQWAAAELGQHGVRVNTISVSGVTTGIFAKVAGYGDEEAETPEVLATVGEKITPLVKEVSPTPRAGTTDDVAAAAVYLASDESGYVIGHNLQVDGGHSLGQPYSVLLAQRARIASALKPEAQ
ncbi:SDR family NAD(P)-dependent oxidoreductase [Amycolatopsis sp. CA-161197]|uniref:SDR family NAD(P)-dependent oxidoreductase n=1 Tax=Amycolatopsis sp. CA-161197 TaxID=3239922 RepID=UPI003D926E3C